jgi:hypothetical protein
MNVEVHVLLLQESNGKWFWACVIDRGDDNGPDIVSRHVNSMAAKDAAWTLAQQLGGTVVYGGGKRRGHD